MDASDRRDEPKCNENAVCERCGKFGACEVAGQWLCPACYETSGSCCPEFGADDLWAERDKKSHPQSPSS
jgi:hypothetical protein